jgi:hypothetical protein
MSLYLMLFQLFIKINSISIGRVLLNYRRILKNVLIINKLPLKLTKGIGKTHVSFSNDQNKTIVCLNW